MGQALKLPIIPDPEGGWKFVISFLARASCGAKNRQGNTRPTAAKRVTKPGQKHQV